MLDAILSLALLILFAKGTGKISEMLEQPIVLGQIVGGIVVGPTLLGLVESSPLIHQIASVGGILLMFLAGLDTNTRLLKQVLTNALIVATLGVAVPFVSGYALGLWLGYTNTVSLFLGTILVATSVSITVQVLKERDQLKTVEGTTILGAAVFDDILGFLVLSVVLAITTTSSKTASFVFADVLLFKMPLLLVLLWLGSRLARPLFDRLEWLWGRTFVISGLLVFAFAYAWIAHFFGLASIVGAYLIGVMLKISMPDRFSGNNQNVKTLERFGNALFIPVFFAVMGLTANFLEMTPRLLGMTALISLIAILSKIVGCGAGALISGMNRITSIRIGCGMVARGEVGLIIAMTAFQMQLIGQDLYSSALLVVIATTLITPFLLSVAFSYSAGKSATDLTKT